ncbi:MAG: hypothetical protein JWQ43_1562 [Glaciihabitans sp.]|nr:hypothetical protein [Glaciihabitans sp.]
MQTKAVSTEASHSLLSRLRETVRLQRSKTPPPVWMTALEQGTDAGFFGPGSAVWTVNGASPTMIAGIRALLLQTLHPGAMAGVHDHSRYRADPMGRLDGTVRWVMTTTFGDTEAATAGSNFVHRLHTRVNGHYTDAGGTQKKYSAHDAELLRWVHDAFTEAFLGAHLIWGGPIPGGPDQYVREWAQSGVLMGVDNPPKSVAELREQMADFSVDFKPDERVAEAVRFLRSPGLPKNLRMIYRLLFAGAVSSLTPEQRRLLSLRRPPWPAITANRLLFGLVNLLLGPVSPSELAARSRVDKLRDPLATA